jgi:hypothetical protein
MVCALGIGSCLRKSLAEMRRSIEAGVVRRVMFKVLKWCVWLSCAWLCAGAASGQVASYTVNVGPGFNAIANHLDRGGNTLNEVLSDVPLGSRLYKYDVGTAGGGWTQPAIYTASAGWVSQGVYRLGPGEGAFLQVTGAWTLRFMGNLKEPELRRDVLPGLNLVSCQVPQPCSFGEVFGFGPVPGDVVYRYNQPIAALPENPEQGASSVHRYLGSGPAGPGGWDVAPVFERGRSALVFLAGAPRVLREPQDMTVREGTNVVFSVLAMGSPPLGYQWFFNGDLLPGQTGSTLTLQAAQFSEGGLYAVVVSNSFGMVTSRLARLVVLAPPRIIEPPQAQTRVLGETAMFSVTAEGTTPLFYQWLFNGNAIPPGTNRVLVISNVSPNHVGKYSVQVSNALGNVTSETAPLTVLIPPFIARQPVSRSVNIGESVTFAVEAGGTAPLRYQWTRNGVPIAGATNQSLTLLNVQPGDGGVYRVRVLNIAGAVESEPAFLRVNVPFHVLADDFAKAELFGDESGGFATSNRGATREPGEPRHAGKWGGKSIWFAWMAQTNGVVRFRTRGSFIDTLLAAYRGDKVDALTEVASDEDSGGYLSSEIVFNVEAGVKYFIAIDGYNGYEGEIFIDWIFEPGPERVPVILEHPVDQAVKLGGDAEFMVRVDAPNATFQWLFNGAPLQGQTEPVLTLRGVDESAAGFYLVRVSEGRRFVFSRPATLQFSLVGPDEEVAPIFARDKFGDVVARSSDGGAGAGGNWFGPHPESPRANATAAGGVVHGYNGTQLFSTLGAVKDEGEPDHCGIAGGASYWFSYVPPASGQMFINTHGSSYDTILAIYTATGPAYADLVSVACDNNSGTNGITSRLNFPAVAGVTYYVVLDGVGGASGTVRLNYKLLLPLVMSNASMTNSFRARITGSPGIPFSIQRSADLTGWFHVLTTNTVSGVYDFRDTNSAVRRYYRAWQAP